jgi:hypothetical protein
MALFDPVTHALPVPVIMLLIRPLRSALQAVAGGAVVSAAGVPLLSTSDWQKTWLLFAGSFGASFVVNLIEYLGSFDSTAPTNSPKVSPGVPPTP